MVESAYPPDLPSCRDHEAAFGIPYAKARNTDLSKETVGQGLTQESSVGDIIVQFELIQSATLNPMMERMLQQDRARALLDGF